MMMKNDEFSWFSGFSFAFAFWGSRTFAFAFWSSRTFAFAFWSSRTFTFGMCEGEFESKNMAMHTNGAVEAIKVANCVWEGTSGSPCAYFGNGASKI